MNRFDILQQLQKQGVVIPHPESVYFGEEVNLAQINGPNTILHPGTRLSGKQLLVSPGCELGREAPVTIDNCALGKNVKLHGGFFHDATFLDDVSFGSGAHVRGGTLLEEQSNAAHTVGLKQTILFPFVTLGSLINFCDVLMAGGTSRRDHSEVGSSFIHFNYTPFGPNGDKATASLIGDVSHGVLLRSPRIFLGGQGGLVGPVQIGYGSVLAAGTVYRRDYGNHVLVVGEASSPSSRPFDARRYTRVRHKLQANLRYIGNIVALWHWYQKIRLRAVDKTSLHAALYQRALTTLTDHIDERISRLDQLVSALSTSITAIKTDTKYASDATLQREVDEQQTVNTRWPAIAERLRKYAEQGLYDHAGLHLLMQHWDNMTNQPVYLERVKQLPPAATEAATAWLQAIVDQYKYN